MKHLFTATPPTPNGPLHLGHASGPYIAADALARLARVRGEDAELVCGIDTHQNYVDVAATQEGKKYDLFLDEMTDQILADYCSLGMDISVLSVPHRSAPYRDDIATEFELLVQAKRIQWRTVPTLWCASCDVEISYALVSGRCSVCGGGAAGGGCEGCGSYMRPIDLEEPSCATCDAALARREVDRWIYLPATEWSDVAVKGLLGPHPVSASVARTALTIAESAPAWIPATWDAGHGVEVDSGSVSGGTQIVDVWVEMGLAYSKMAREARGAYGNVNLTHAFGVDNAFYFTLLFPSMYEAINVSGSLLVDWRMNFFLKLDGAKFSTSRRHAIWVHEVAGEIAPADLRETLLRTWPSQPNISIGRASWMDFGSRTSSNRITSSLDAIDVDELISSFMSTGACFDPSVALRMAEGRNSEMAMLIRAVVRGEVGSFAEASREDTLESLLKWA